MIDLCGLTEPELVSAVVALGEKPYRARQLMHWVYGRRVFDFERMTDLPAQTRQRFAGEFRILSTHLAERVLDPDGTVKLLVELADGHGIECVLIPQGPRRAGCVSTQVGCGVGCRFCASGMGGLVRNLSPAEIVEQVLHLEAASGGSTRLDNLVFMGVGEPMANYEALVQSIRVLNDPHGLGLAARRMTVSTVGIPGTIERLAEEGLQVNLAVSLHAPDDATRRAIVPRTGLMTVSELVGAAQLYRERTGRDVTFEYVIIANVNDSVVHARRLARLLTGKPATVNVIELNEVSELAFGGPSPAVVHEFIEVLRRAGLNVTHRRRKGIGARAACGQLRLHRAGGESPS